MRFFAVILLCISSIANAQIITTIAGNGTLGDTGDGTSATAAAITEPFACAFDSHGNFYFTEVASDKVRKINSSGTISTFAGGGSSFGDGGPATAAQFSNPVGIAIDASDNVYIMDSWNYRLRKINAITGIISTIAGNGSPGYGSDNGPASSAIINANNICIDGIGNIYLCDAGNNRIRKINTSGIITTYAGTGLAGYSGDGGMATAAQISPSIGICVDHSNNVYFGQANNIRKISATGVITTIAGNGSSSPTGDGGLATVAGVQPYMLAFDNSDNLYLSGYVLNTIRKINNHGIIYTVAGNGTAAYGGDGGPATAADLHTPIGITTDSCGNLFIADRDDNHIRKVAFNPFCWRVGVKNVIPQFGISIFPNPTQDFLYIENIVTQTTYRLLKVTGILIKQGILTEGNNMLSLQSLPFGIYILELIDNNGNKTVKEIIKQ